VIQPSRAEELPDSVRAALKAAGISQVEACRHLGVSEKHLSQMLTGKVALTLPWAERILALCGWRLVIALETLPKEPTP
jgi:transcriptional regulator with XRE-family HTH domain